MIIDLSDDRLFTNAFWKINEALKAPTRFKIVYGGSGSSKSHSYYQHFIIDILQEKHHDFLVLRKYGTTIEQSIYNGIKNIITNWGLYDLFEFTKRPYIIRNKLTGVKILMIGVDDPEKLKSLVNVKKVLLEEATDFSFSDFKEINRRVRGIENIQIGLCFNPISHTHWIKKHFFDNPELKNKTSIIKCFYQDNNFLTLEDIEQLEALKKIDENDYRVYVKGEWGILTERLVFKNWAIVDEIPIKAKRIPTGLDFGFAEDPAAMTDHYILNDDLYLDELLYETNLTNIRADVDDQISIEERLDELKYDKQNLIIADSSEPKSIRELRNAGFNIYGVKKYPGSLKDGIKLMKSVNIYITRRSKNTINEFENYVYKIDKDGNILPEPIDKNNHSIDETRYVMLMKNKMW